MGDHFYSSPLKRSHSYIDRHPLEASARLKRHQSSRDSSSTSRSFIEEVVFRLLCPISKTGSVIGKGGSIVKAIRQETGAKITVSDAVPGAEERVILISAHEGDSDRGGDDDFEGKDNEAIDVEKANVRKLDNGGRARGTPAQEALFRVHARIIDDERENALGAGEGHGKVYIKTRLLVSSRQAGSLLGRGGRFIEQMREDSGAQIRILPRDQLPACAHITDEVVQVIGEVNAVERALQLISSRLLENSLRDRNQSSLNSTGDASSKHSDTFSRRTDSFCGDRGQRGSRSPTGTSSGSRLEASGRSFRSSLRSSFSPSVPVVRDHSPPEDELVFRILCPSDRIGSIIGRGGTIIQNLREETGAKIKVEELVPGSDERVVVVSSPEDSEDLSPAQEAVFHIQDKFKDVGPNEDCMVTTRLLVPSHQVGCLLGRGGDIIAEMRRTSKASIRILGREHLPKCAQESDEVVQIRGDIQDARDALNQITSRLRANLCREKGLPPVGSGPSPSFRNDPLAFGYGGGHTPASPRDMRASISGLGLPNGHSARFQNGNSSPDSWRAQHAREREFPSFEDRTSRHRGIGDLGRFTGGIITSTRVEVVIPNEAVASVLGKDGSNMAQIRQLSGANVNLYDARDGASESTVEISGTPEQTGRAQSLLQAFILSGQS